MQRCGYVGERRAEKPNRDDEATHTPAAAGSNYDRQACRDKEKEGCAWCAGAQHLGLLEGSGKRERQWSSGRRSHTGARAQLEWPRGPGGVRGEQPDFSPRQTLSPRPWLPLVEPGQEQSSREPENKDAWLQEGEGVRGQRRTSPQLISDPNCISPFAARAGRSRDHTAGSLCSAHSAVPLALRPMGTQQECQTKCQPVTLSSKVCTALLQMSSYHVQH